MSEEMKRDSEWSLTRENEELKSRVDWLRKKAKRDYLYALEQAAKLCDGRAAYLKKCADESKRQDERQRHFEAGVLAAAIRELAKKATT